MDIHKPDPVHSWRDLAKEVGIIVLGVLIALAVRVLLSMGLVAFLVLSYWMGWIAPSGLR